MCAYSWSPYLSNIMRITCILHLLHNNQNNSSVKCVIIPQFNTVIINVTNLFFASVDMKTVKKIAEGMRYLLKLYS